MTVKKLRPFPSDTPPPPSVPRVRCVASVSRTDDFERRWREDRYAGEEPFRCSREGVVEIDDKAYCRLHAGHRVLDMYIRGELKRV